MKKLFIIVLFVSSSFGSLIGDFAPTKVGTTWKYYYSYYGDDIIIFENSVLTIEIELMSKQLRGNDTLVLLKVNEQGKDVFDYPPNIYDTTHIDTIFTDTAIISSDSIYKAAGYRCPVFPYWKSHFIDSANLIKGISGLDTWFFISNMGYSSSNPGTYVYMEGIGLYSMFFNFHGNSTVFIKDSLISYNNKEISPVTPVVSKLPSKSVPGYKASLFNSSKTLILKNGIKLSRDAFLVNGKRIIAGEIVPNEAVIINKSEPVNVKNR